MNKNAALLLRMKRQGFISPLTGTEYDELFRGLSPVMCEYWSRPGDPPRLFQRSAEDDFNYNDMRRSERRILKGRFQGGNIAYIERSNLQMFACLYKKNVSLSVEALEILELLKNEGPLSPKQIRELTGYGKLVPAALQKLQESFLVFEDQVDCEWDRGFYAFVNEFPDVNLDLENSAEILLKLLPRFWKYIVFATEENVKSFYKLPAKDIKKAVETLIESGVLIQVEDTIVLADDLPLFNGEEQIPRSIFALHRNDFLVKAHEHALKSEYAHEKHKVIYYLLIDGEISGAVLGRFSNIENELEEAVFDNAEDQGRIEEVEAALAEVTKARLRRNT